MSQFESDHRYPADLRTVVPTLEQCEKYLQQLNLTRRFCGIADILKLDQALYQQDQDSESQQTENEE